MIVIREEFKKLIPALTGEEFKQLEANILSEGIRDPLVLWKGYLVDGHNRYAIATEHGLDYKTVNKDFKDSNEVKLWMIDNQSGRRNLTDGWKYKLQQVKKQILLEKGKETQGTRTDILSTIDKKLEPKHNTRQEIAKALDWSTGKVAMADIVFKKATPELEEKVLSNEVTINQAYQEIKKEQKKEERLKKIENIKVSIEQENKSLEGVFDVIAIDPPWEYSEKGGFSSAQHDEDSNRGGVDYPTMTLEELKLLELPCKENCVLYLWTTHAFLKDSFDLLTAWGFTYKAVITWDKEKMGMGRNIRMQCEFCLLAVKGSPILEGASVRDIIREPRREHSRKPIAFYELVETMTTGRRLDFFAREQRKNWEVYGAEVGKF
jgi:N6-adenosine-specific RNA methylase IME4/ParB-like chromosome segregation protein Spo0J